MLLYLHIAVHPLMLDKDEGNLLFLKWFWCIFKEKNKKEKKEKKGDDDF
jgi:hypothetical protein